MKIRVPWLKALKVLLFVCLVLHEHQLPDSLNQLVPDFLPEVPLDPITGTSMRYGIVDPAYYILWSVGWNQTDEGGTPPENSTDRMSNDRVWKGSVTHYSE